MDEDNKIKTCMELDGLWGIECGDIRQHQLMQAMKIASTHRAGWSRGAIEGV
jgi:hypothetical protein